MRHLQIPRREVFQASTQHHGRDEFKRWLLAQLFEQNQNDHSAGAIDRQPRAMQRATVHEHAFGNKCEIYLPHPADEAEDEEHHDQIDQRVAAVDADSTGFTEFERHRSRRKTPRINGSIQNILADLHLVKILAIFLITVHRIGMQNTDAEPFGQDSGESTRLGRGEEPLFDLCHGLGDIGIRGMKRLWIGLEVQVFVVEHLAACNAGSLGHRTYVHIVFHEERGIVAIEIEDTAQAEGDEVEQIPAEERAVRHEAFPFMPFHHVSGQTNSVQSLDIRILCDDVRHHTVGVLLDEVADDG